MGVSPGRHKSVNPETSTANAKRAVKLLLPTPSARYASATSGKRKRGIWVAKAALLNGIKAVETNKGEPGVSGEESASDTGRRVYIKPLLSELRYPQFVQRGKRGK